MSAPTLRRACSHNKYFVREVNDDLVLETSDGKEIARRSKEETGIVVRKTLGMGNSDIISQTEIPFHSMSVDDFVWSLTQDPDYLPV